jgi:hypothetical protein
MATYDLRNGTLYYGGTNNPVVNQQSNSSVIYTGAGFVNERGTQYGSPVYQKVFNPEGYQSFAEERIKTFQSGFDL